MEGVKKEKIKKRKRLKKKRKVGFILINLIFSFRISNIVICGSKEKWSVSNLNLG